MINLCYTDDHQETKFINNTQKEFSEALILPQTWLYLSEPTEEEISLVAKTTKINEMLIRSLLDAEESAHIDEEGKVTVVVVDTPIVRMESKYPEVEHYTTIPLANLINDEFVVTICTQKDIVIPNLIKNNKNLSPQKPVRLIIQILFRNAQIFVSKLKEVDKGSEFIQTKLQEALKNSDLFELLNLGKSLVYLSTGLNSNQVVLEKLKNHPLFLQFQDGLALIDDTIIENRQAMEMCAIHRDILNGLMDAYASVISNNVSSIMKTLTVLT
ncbi:MAG TPA: magnesium transporter CorA family protein, partial [Bacilli bacterium]|nr:magnesium transporter CorA family protein [Bacilli bacterium]